jgi:membrane dipeptidase
MVQGIIEAHPDKFAAGHTPALCRTNFELGKISLPMGMENGSPIETDLKNIQYFYDRGIRYVTLTHSKDNQICDSSYDTTRTWGGLSPFGYQVVSEMNKVGMMIDISHVSDSTFYQVMRLTSAPCIASHSSCRKFTPGFERNMSDDMIRVLGENGGVIQINFGSTFIDGEIRDGRTEIRRRRQELLDKHGLEAGDDKAKPLLEKFKRDNQDLIFSDVEMVANHIDHAVKLAGINHVGFGSDYDGVGDSLPTGLKDVSQYPNLIYVLLKRGYSPEDIEKLCYKNVWRVWNTVTEQAG